MSIKRRDHSYQCLAKEWQLQNEVFEDQVIVEEPTIAPKSKTTLAITNNEILEVEYKIQRILPIVLEGDARVEYDNQWQTYFERKSQLEKKHRQELSMIQVQ